MKKYQIGIVLHPKMEEAAIKEEHDAIVELIGRFGGIVDKIDNWGRKKLAYEINKIHEGFFCFINVHADSSFAQELESRLRIRENIIRYLIIKDESIIKPVSNKEEEDKNENSEYDNNETKEPKIEESQETSENIIE